MMKLMQMWRGKNAELISLLVESRRVSGSRIDSLDLLLAQSHGNIHFDNLWSVLWVIDQSLKAHCDVAPNSLLIFMRTASSAELFRMLSLHLSWTSWEALNAMMITYTSMNAFPSIIWLPDGVWGEEGKKYFRVKSPESIKFINFKCSNKNKQKRTTWQTIMKDENLFDANVCMNEIDSERWSEAR